MFKPDDYAHQRIMESVGRGRLTIGADAVCINALTNDLNDEKVGEGPDIPLLQRTATMPLR